MKGKIAAFVLVLGFLVLLIPVVKGASMKPGPVPKPLPRPEQSAVIDVAFCLDTTGSMSGLLEGAKQKIWSIVNTVSSAQPKPVLRIALVAYRDEGDAYVTQKFDFTTDLETMYSRLRDFQAGGGGDTPEHVNRALHEAANGLSWSGNPGALKIIYLVGDAPPHMDYQDGYDYRRITKDAASKGIIVNTVQCGTIDGTREIWQEVARLAEGKYIAIDQTGGMMAVASPYDEELSTLSRELNRTYVAYGKDGGRMVAAQKANDADAETRAPAVAADRAASKAGELYKNESWDLVDALNSKAVKLNEVPAEELPEDLRGKSEAEQQAYVETKSKERARIQLRIQELSSKRDAFVQSELKKSGAKTERSFDAQVLTSLKEQGREKGISFEK